jgi:hypothetical protein
MDILRIFFRHHRNVCCLFFSKDRPLQLDAALSSFRLNCLDSSAVRLNVLYTTSSPEMQLLYQQVSIEHPDVCFVRESRFREDVLSILKNDQHFLFVVDDCLFIRPFSLSSAVSALQAHPSALGVSLRLGRNVVLSYAMVAHQTVPEFKPLDSVHEHSEWYRFLWPGCDHDFGYPLELSSSLYRRRELLPLLRSIPFSNPNQLEDALAWRSHQFARTHPWLLTALSSLAFCNPCNRVQSEFLNRAGASPHQSSDALAKAYAEGFRARVVAFSGYTPQACHEEVDLPLVRTAGPVDNSQSY